MGTQLSDAGVMFVRQGDHSMQSLDYLSAIGYYRKAIEDAPRSALPRVRLASAYLADGLKDQAGAEARKALAIDPSSVDAKQFLETQSDDGAVPGGDVAIARAQTDSDPGNTSAWIALGDAYWNASDPDDALISYQRAADTDTTAIVPQTRLARLFAARGQYGESLTSLQKSGKAGYPYALKIIASRTESLIGDLDSSINQFDHGDLDREDFYNQLKAAAKQSEGLADFVGKISPPDAYRISHLHRQLATRLVSQCISIWISFLETGDSTIRQQAEALERNSVAELKTADVAEKLQADVAKP